MHFSLHSLFSLPSFDETGAQSLPQTRKELFFSVLHQHRFSIFLFSLGCAGLLLPAEIWTFVHLLLLKRYLTVPEATLPSGWLSRYLLVLIPLTAVSGPFLAGPARIIRNWARGESANPVCVFQEAVKTSWKQTLLLTFLTSCLPLLLYSAALYRQASGTGVLATVIFWALIIISVLWLLMLPLLFVIAVTYNLPFSHILWDGIYLTFRHFGRALKRFLLSLIPLAVLLFACAAYPYAFALLAALYFALYVLFFYGLHALLGASYANEVCENELNIHIPGTRADIGLASEYTVPADSEKA